MLVGEIQYYVYIARKFIYRSMHFLACVLTVFIIIIIIIIIHSTVQTYVWAMVLT